MGSIIIEPARDRKKLAKLTLYGSFGANLRGSG